MNLFHLGIKDNVTPYMKGKIKLTNQVSTMCAFIGFFYSFFVYAHYPELVVYPASLFVISSILLVLTRFGFVSTARFLASFEMLVLASLFHASIIQAGDSVLVSFFCSMLAMTLIPWVLFGMQEKKELITSLAICYGLLLFQGVLNKQIEVPVDVTFFRESYLDIMTYAFAIAIAIVLMVMMKQDKSEQYAS